MAANILDLQKRQKIILSQLGVMKKKARIKETCKMMTEKNVLLLNLSNLHFRITKIIGSNHSPTIDYI